MFDNDVNNKRSFTISVLSFFLDCVITVAIVVVVFQVQIFNEKVIVNTVAGKCNSLANVKHKPGGGNLQIIDQKLDFSSNTQSKVRSFQNIKHVPGGGDKKAS
ncbi:unnamed protein product [Schistosoma margrebowiei]|uniref:Microtubule-associated protein n=1 Tax=Schistosoma margrebowiei TaxID=48269 RepID=A0A3P8B1Y3_9TREM|nr:unnamed protein product [Schistosoma margrebowiei]